MRCAKPGQLLADSSRSALYLTCGDGTIEAFKRDASGNYAKSGSMTTAPGATAALLVPTQRAGLSRRPVEQRAAGGNPHLRSRQLAASGGLIGNPVDDGGPVARLRLAKEAKAGIPGAVAAPLEPAPIGDMRQ